MGKLFNGLLQNRLDKYLESNELLSKYQFGFRKNHRTTDNIFILKTLTNKYLGLKKQNIYACFVDFSKAFDTVDRTALLHKLYKKGIGGKFYKLIRNMYSHTKYSCKVESFVSDPFWQHLVLNRVTISVQHYSISLLMTSTRTSISTPRVLQI